MSEQTPVRPRTNPVPRPGRVVVVVLVDVVVVVGTSQDFISAPA